MMVQGILLPVFVLVGLTFALLFWSGARRPSWFAQGKAGPADAGAAIYDPLQLVTLFYVLVAMALPLRQADLVMVMLAWVFVVTRFLYAGVLVSSQGERNRPMAYLAGALVLLAMWVYFALKILMPL
ncbi:MAPEG family protein [Bradyrhizobium prioriisuperbiae]|uniref:MAPEG family protein n=1 Tax=Bradyrhizobium prioriisuperbiae TaxID=2854389 RepID=UPI0028E44CEC|nr:MAPEG family protein [Bradyrhizobium prioritasuperba]